MYHGKPTNDTGGTVLGKFSKNVSEDII